MGQKDIAVVPLLIQFVRALGCKIRNENKETYKCRPLYKIYFCLNHVLYDTEINHLLNRFTFTNVICK